MIQIISACSSRSEDAEIINLEKTNNINIEYTYFSSLDDTKINNKANLSYGIYDSLLQYNLIVNDSLLFYKYSNEHGIFNLKTHDIVRNNQIDSLGIPIGDFESGLFPEFVTNSNYLFELVKDTINNGSIIKNIGALTLIEKFNGVGSVTSDLVKFIDSKEYLCFNNISNKILFEYSIYNFSINGLVFSQKELKKYKYSTTKFSDFNQYKIQVKNAQELVNKEKQNKQLKTSTIIPEFAFTDLKNNALSSSKINEKIILLEFWYISCAPCLKNMKILDEIYLKYKEKDVKFLILNDRDLNVDKINQIKEKYKLQYDLFCNGEILSKELNVFEHPYTIIYNNETKKIICKYIGTSSKYKEEIETVLDSLTN